MKTHTQPYKILVTVIALCGLSFIPGDCSSGMMPTKGTGCWVQVNSINNPHIYSDVFSWYIMPIALLKDFKDTRNRPVFWGFSGKSPEALISMLDEYKGRIAGVVWNYEITGNRENSEKDLRAAYLKAKSLNMSFGICISMNPETASRLIGIEYRHADKFADFVMPMLYVQSFSGLKYPLLSHRRQKVEEMVAFEKRESPVPIVPVIALATTQRPKSITPDELVQVYKDLPVPAFAVWNVQTLNEDYLGAISALNK